MHWYLFSRLCYKERTSFKTEVKKTDFFFNIQSLIIKLSDALTSISFCSCILHFQITLTVSVEKLFLFTTSIKLLCCVNTFL